MSDPAPRCDKCCKQAVLTTGAMLYPNRYDLAEKSFWICSECGAYVGCHPGTVTPLGSLAGKRTRLARMMAHRAFDVFWKDRGGVSRGRAYRLLAAKLGLEHIHIGQSGYKRCAMIVRAVRELEAEHPR